MTETEWLTEVDPREMMRAWDKGPVGARKLRLFACACCRRIWHLLTDVCSRETVQVTERWADGGASDAELGQAADALEKALEGAGDLLHPDATVAAHWCAQTNGSEDPAYSAAYEASLHTANASATMVAPEKFEEAWEAARAAEYAHQAQLLRDIIRYLSPSVAFNPAWRTPTVASLAHAAYNERDLPSGHLDSNRLAVLADSLENAGCTEAAILEHLRGPGSHVRGCWVLDLLLGKQ